MVPGVAIFLFLFFCFETDLWELQLVARFNFFFRRRRYRSIKIQVH